MSNNKPLRKQGILSKELGNEILLYRKDGKAIHVLNRTAHSIWELCDGQHTVQEMENAIRAQFQLPDQAGSQPQASADVAADIERSLAMFADAGLLEQNESQSEPQSEPQLVPKP